MFNILVADDDKNTRRFMKAVLEAEQYNVFTAKDGDKDIGRIFGKFYQGDTSHSSEGTGLGLAIAKKITELHGGEISVSSAEDKTTFTIKLPV